MPPQPDILALGRPSSESRRGTTGQGCFAMCEDTYVNVSRARNTSQNSENKPERCLRDRSANPLAYCVLPRSKEGNTTHLVFFDTFTKWVELIPLRKATTATLIPAFRERIISHFGAPMKLVCDNGSQFTSKASRFFLRKREWNPSSPPHTAQERIRPSARIAQSRR